MKYKIKYLIRHYDIDYCSLETWPLHDYSYSDEIYNIDNCELIDDVYKIKMHRNILIILDLLFIIKYSIRVKYLDKYYYALSEKDLKKYKKRHPHYYNELLKYNNIKTIKDIIIENILE